MIIEFSSLIDVVHNAIDEIALSSPQIHTEIEEIEVCESSLTQSTTTEEMNHVR